MAVVIDKMPGQNCSIFGCGTCRNQKEYGLFKLPNGQTEADTKWRREMLNIITKHRIVDDKLKEKINENKIWICQKHFDDDQIYFYPTRKTLKEGALPKKNLPVKSIPTTEKVERSNTSILKRESTSSSLHYLQPS